MAFVLLIAVGVPIGGCLYALYKQKWMPYVLGISAFAVSQMLIRIPFLEYLAAESSSYLWWSVKYPVSFILFLALSAGIAEELARWLAMTFLMKQRDPLSGIVFGIGHGGIEAFLIVGLPLMTSVNLAVSWLSGAERIIAICIHIGLSLIVLKAVSCKRISYLLFAIGLHAIINFIAGMLSTMMAPIVIECVLLILAIATLFTAYLLYRKEEKV